MIDDDDLIKLRNQKIPAPDPDARKRALGAAMAAFEAEQKNADAPQGSTADDSLMDRVRKLWSEMMNRKMMTAAPAMGALLALPIAGYATYMLIQQEPVTLGEVVPTVKEKAAAELRKQAEAKPVAPAEGDNRTVAPQDAAPTPEPEAAAAPEADVLMDAAPPVAPLGAGGAQVCGAAGLPPCRSVAPATANKNVLAAPPVSERSAEFGGRKAVDGSKVAPRPQPLPADDVAGLTQQDRERFEATKTNPVKLAIESPVSTFSIDVDTASYSYVRRSLKEGVLPRPDTVRVEEMVNYFPYDYAGPESAEVPFKPTVTVMPTPWNQNTKLMHVAIKGYDLQQATRPKANLVFLIDVSGSMDEADKLPLLRSAFRMLVNKLGPDDTVSIVTYAGDAGTVLEPTKASEKDKILNAIDTLTPGGSTAGEAGIKEAYRLAQQSFVADGVNRVMLATDGDFNVGQTDDDDLKRLIEEKRRSGVFLSVFGFGRGNLNDQMMQTIAQNGNGTAAYIDTLAEAEKVLVEDAASTLFTIAKDVKIQVEFNPQTISEYRLIGYETRALAREDFNNDKVDAGEIGAGHSVTAIYEITPKGSPAEQVDDLRYGEAKTDNASGVAHGGEYAFVKIRYKLPDGDISKLIETPVTASNEVATFDQAGNDQRFSVAVAAFGQKLRGTTQTDDFGYDRISQIATAARGADPFGYRAEFLQLVRLADALTVQPVRRN